MPSFNSIISDLKHSLLHHPYEDGHIAPAASIVSQLLEDHEIEFLKYLMVTLPKDPDISFIADTLRCVGHLAPPEWSDILFQKALSHPSIVIRDATVQMLELNNRISILKTHKETVNWLKSYIEEVIKESESSN